MAQLNFTLNLEEMLQLLSSENKEELLKKILQDALNAILKAESEEQLHASPGERTEERTDYRNGTRPRNWITRIGTIKLRVPRHRNLPFKTMLFDSYSRSEAALIACMAEMVVNGVSTRKVANVMKILCGYSFSKSSVSEVCKVLNEDVKKFRNRPLTGKYLFVILDATYFKVREDHKVISKAFMLAFATNQNGIREIIGFGVYPGEKDSCWEDFLQGIKARGLKGVEIFTSDARSGIIKAVSKVFPESALQRCQVHLSRDILDKVPKKYHPELKAKLKEVFHADTIEAARLKRDTVYDEYEERFPAAMNVMDNGFEDAMVTMVLPESIRIHVRTSNHIERINRELKRRSNVIGIFPNEDSLIRLMGSVIIEYNDILQQRESLFGKITYEKVLDLTEIFKQKASVQHTELFTA